MYFFRKLFGFFFLGLLIIGLFGFFGRMGHGRYESAYQQGFIAGQQTAAAASGTVPETGAAPNAVPGANVYFRGHGFFFPGFGLLLCLIPFFFIGLVFMAFGGRRRHGRYRHWQGGPCGAKSWRHQQRWEDDPKEKSPDIIDDGRDGRSDEPIMHA